jgi:signal transduction histidine kinase
MIGKFFKNSINVKILLPMIVIQGLLIFFLMYLLLTLTYARRDIASNTEQIRRVNRLSSRLNELQKQSEVQILSYRFNQNDSILEMIEQDNDEIRKTLAEMDGYINTTRGRELKDQYIISQEGIIQINAELIAAIQKNSTEDINRNFDRWLVKSQNINAALQDMNNYNLSTIERTRVVYEGLMRRAFAVALSAVASTFLLIVFLYSYLRKLVTVPLSVINADAEKISRGQFDKLNSLNRLDEMGDLSRNINRMARNLQLNYQRLEREVEEKENALVHSRELERRKDDFISMASHELKTPVTSIKVFNQILEKSARERSDPNSLKYLVKMREQIDRLTRIIGELLDVSRIQAGKLELNLEPVSLDLLCADICETLQASIPTHKIVYKGVHIGTVMLDKDRIGQVLINLINNATKYSPEGTEVIVNLTEDEDDATVCVTDFGMGIDPEYHSRIFERFYRVYDKDEKTFPGLGMGLYISSEIVKKHGGKIWVESSPGDGSTFYFKVPVKSG